MVSLLDMPLIRVLCLLSCLILCAALPCNFASAQGLSGEALNLANNAATLLQSGNPAAALTMLQQAYPLAPSSWDISYYVAVALEQTGKLDDAQAWYKKAYSLDPTRHLAFLDSHVFPSCRKITHRRYQSLSSSPQAIRQLRILIPRT